jgi:PTS system nitrogen regulatory IIA component
MIFLLVPEVATQKHLETLSEIAEMLSDPELRHQLFISTSSQDVHGRIVQWHSTHVAH